VRLGLSARQGRDHHRILVINVAAHPGHRRPEDLLLMIDVNVGATLWLTQAVVPYLRERGSGSIVPLMAGPPDTVTGPRSRWQATRASPAVTGFR
jgi:NADP-dependent 3-hydroxy acid dehydrogenase YdfG